jgi:hypothetical protein
LARRYKSLRLSVELLNVIIFLFAFFILFLVVIFVFLVIFLIRALGNIVLVA